VSVALPSASAVTIYFTAINDRMLDLTADSMPVSVQGVLYVPYTVFDANLTGVNLRVFYGQDREAQTLTLYNRQKLLTFHLSDGTVTDQDGNSYTSGAIIRNGKTYVPIFFVCNFFGLSCNNIYTEYGYLIRIKNEDAVLTDAQFVAAAPSSMQYRLNEYNKSQATPVPSATVTPTATPTPSTPATGDGPRVYLAFRCGQGDPSALLDQLDAYGVQALLLFRPEQLADYADVIRRAVATGHTIGFTLDSGLTAGQVDELLAQGEQLLEAIAYTRAHIAEVADGTGEERSALIPRGWICWQQNVSGIFEGRTSASAAANIFSGISAKTTLARVLMDDSETSAAALPRLLSRCKQEQLSILPVTETSLSS
jgi:hypothetical protein